MVYEITEASTNKKLASSNASAFVLSNAQILFYVSIVSILIIFCIILLWGSGRLKYNSDFEVKKDPPKSILKKDSPKKEEPAKEEEDSVTAMSEKINNAQK